MTCKHCQGEVSGYKCDVCGATSSEHDANHACGGEHCLAMCAACSQAETKCTCVPA